MDRAEGALRVAELALAEARSALAIIAEFRMVKGEPGERGPRGDPGEPGYDGVPGKDGCDGAPGKDAPVGRVHGLFDEKASYSAFDIVTHNGSEWRARRDNPGPLPGDGWALGASKGKRGDRGDRGERGPAGPKGDASAALIGATIENETLVLSLSDGGTVACDLYPLLERARG